MAGIGFGADGGVVGEVSRDFPQRESAKRIALITGCNEMGFFLGPILLPGILKIRLNLLLNITVDSHNSVAFFCGILWLVAFIFAFFAKETPSDTKLLIENETTSLLLSSRDRHNWIGPELLDRILFFTVKI